ncbi:hypothetical protein CRG98_026050 [Punica granatum]|uniref:Uncharacterized protein n=1 Tax=Punica granatum TaxID=22663 RepID=A0A2I0JCE4_PUNGR|nr:hypothetical protein CRG98_026050 [Punica granatum]
MTDTYEKESPRPVYDPKVESRIIKDYGFEPRRLRIIGIDLRHEGQSRSSKTKSTRSMTAHVLLNPVDSK